MFSEIVEKSRKRVPVVEARVEGRSTVQDRQPRNSCRQICCVFVAQAAAGCRWNETSAGDDQRQTEDDSRQQDTPEQHQRATDA